MEVRGYHKKWRSIAEKDPREERRVISFLLTKEEWDFVMRYAVSQYPRTPLGLIRVGKAVSDLVRDGIGYWMETLCEERRASTIQEIRDVPHHVVSTWPQPKSYVWGEGDRLKRRARIWGIEKAKALRPYVNAFVRKRAKRKRRKALRKASERGSG